MDLSGPGHTPPRGVVRAAAVVGSIVAASVAWFCLFSLFFQPPRSIHSSVVIGVCAAVGIWLWWAFLQEWFRGITWRWIASVVMACCLATFWICMMWSPAWLWMAMWLGVMLTALGVLVAATLRLGRSRADSFLAVGIAIFLTLSTTYWYGGIVRFGADTRLRLVADDYLAQVPDSLKNDDWHFFPYPADRFVGIDEVGNPVAVGWIWNHGLAVGSHFGVAHMPGIELEPNQFGTGRPKPRPDFGDWYPHHCRHAFDEFYFCLFG